MSLRADGLESAGQQATSGWRLRPRLPKLLFGAGIGSGGTATQPAGTAGTAGTGTSKSWWRGGKAGAAAGADGWTAVPSDAAAAAAPAPLNLNPDASQVGGTSESPTTSGASPVRVALAALATASRHPHTPACLAAQEPTATMLSPERWGDVAKSLGAGGLNSAPQQLDNPLQAADGEGSGGGDPLGVLDAGETVNI